MIRIGIIGAGAWGRNHVRTFAAMEGVSLVGVADARRDVREKLERSLPGLTTYETASSLLDSSGVDAVVIATPSPTHADLGCLALQAGKHVLVEKPLALTSADARRMVGEAEKAGKVLMVGHLLLYHSAVLYLRRLVDDGELGDPLYLYCERVNLGVIRKTENALWSLAPHDFSVAGFLLSGRPTDVTARGAAYLQDGIHDVVFANLRFDGGQMANVHVSWLDPHKSRRMVLVGSRKMAVFDDMAGPEKVRIYDKSATLSPRAVGYEEFLAVRSGDILIPKVPMVEPLRQEAEHFCECVREGKTPRSDGRNGLMVVEMLEAAQESLEAGGAPMTLSSGMEASHDG
ncbi:MAG: Gfo/Idh/MocA family oxidoreductase [Acidobacteriota bacterium]|nr:Gfo/Idh/MocA family oxidoreductase [Acidobacteriota bacterium]